MTEPVVERETRETLRPWSRLAARGLVVAGFAGGIWLLTSTAAHAAGDTGPGTAHRAAGAAHHHRPVHHPARGGILARLLGLESTVAPTVHHAGLLSQVLLPSGTTPAARSGCGVPPTVASQPTVGRTRIAMAPVPAGPLSPVFRLAGPVISPLTATLTPVTGAVDALAGQVTGSVEEVTGSALSWLTPPPAARRLVGGPLRCGAPAGATPGPAAVAQPADGRDRHRHPAVAHSTAARGRVGRVGSTHLPTLPRPAPLPAYPGPGLTGTPTTSVSQHGGGSAAVVPTTAVSAPAALRRLSTVAQVEARRLIAEAPTVSPD